MCNGDERAVHPEKVIHRAVVRTFVGRRPIGSAILTRVEPDLSSEIKKHRRIGMDGESTNGSARQGVAADVAPIGAAVYGLPNISLSVATKSNVDRVGRGRVDCDMRTIPANIQWIGTTVVDLLPNRN